MTRTPSGSTGPETETIPDTGPGDVGPSVELARGETLGRYLVLERLGSGAMGVVYAAYDPELDRRVAIKLLKPRSDEDVAHARLRREAQALAKLAHPNVVAVHDVGLHAERLYVAMELVEGQTLRAWIRQEDRDWRQVLSVYVQAAEGLAAAHEAGLVHRDFKPDNVMLGADGRARVMDFGLARGEEDDADPRGSAEPEETPVTGSRSPSLTRTGAVMGTPAYMAPEQHMGLATDARSDQFAFCVSLYEALFGERPFEGPTAAALALQTSSGEIRKAPAQSSVPQWLRRTVVRGLSADPQQRHESMTRLAAQLKVDPARARLRWATAAAVLTTVGLGAFFGSARQTAPPTPAKPCAGLSQPWEALWTPARAEAVRASFAETASPIATAVANRVVAAIDARGARWSDARRSTCLATRVQGTQSERLLDLKMACLDRALDQTRALIEVLETADTALVAKAVQAVAGLPRVADCEDAELVDTDLPPATVEQRERLTQAQARLADVEALDLAGRYPRAAEQIDPVVTLATEIGYEPFLAAVTYERGRLSERTGSYDAALEQLGEAYHHALASGVDDVAIKSSASLAVTWAYRKSDFESAGRWERTTQALVRRHGPGHEVEAFALNNLGVVALVAGKFDEVVPRYERAIEVKESLRGPDHPDIPIYLNNLSIAASRRGDLDEASALLERALQIWENTVGPDHPNYADTLTNLGNNAYQRADYALARDRHARALEIRTAIYPGNHHGKALSLSNLGSAAAGLDDHDAALDYHRRARAMFEAVHGEDHPLVATATGNIADSLQSLGRPAEALPLFEQALTAREKAAKPGDPRLAYPLLGVGICLVALDRASEAIPSMERALKLRVDAKVDPVLIATSQFELAVALHDSGKRARASKLAAEALTAFEAAGERADDAETRVRAWMEAQSR